jgi:peroxiredoxin
VLLRTHRASSGDSLLNHVQSNQDGFMRRLCVGRFRVRIFSAAVRRMCRCAAALLAALLLILSSPLAAREFKPPDPGDPAPDFTLRTPSGDRITLSDSWRLRKKPVTILSFYSWTCRGCLAELTFLQQLRAQLGNPGLEVVIVGIDEDCDETAKTLVQNGITLPMVCDSYKIVSQRFGLKAILPSSYIIDGKGVYRENHVGFCGKKKIDIETTVRRLMGK